MGVLKCGSGAVGKTGRQRRADVQAGPLPHSMSSVEGQGKRDHVDTFAATGYDNGII